MRCGKNVISVDGIVSLISPSANPPMIIDSDSERLKAFLRHESRSASYIERREALTGGSRESRKASCSNRNTDQYSQVVEISKVRVNLP